MTQYATNFSEYTTGNAPSDWTEQWFFTAATPTIEVAPSELGGKSLRLSNDLGAPYALSWDDIGNITDSEVLAKCRSDVSSSDVLDIVVRGSGDFITLSGYICRVTISTGRLYLTKYVNGIKTDITNVSGKGFAIDTWYWMRFQVQGNALKLKAWDASVAEPAAWDIETIDSDVASGWAGVGKRLGNLAHWDYFTLETSSSSWPVSVAAPDPPIGEIRRTSEGSFINRPFKQAYTFALSSSAYIFVAREDNDV